MKDIEQWAVVRRAQDSRDGSQRVLRETRKKAITRFVKANSINTIPNNILLAFEPGKASFTSLEENLTKYLSGVNTHNGCEQQLEWGVLEFSFNKLSNERCAYVVDGQHRLYGLSEFASEDIPMLVVSLLDAKVNINALNEFIADRLKFAWELSLVDIFESEQLEKQVLNIVTLLPTEFWQAEWSIKLQDSTNVRKQIKDDLSTLADNCRLRRPWNQELRLPVTDEGLGNDSVD